MDNASKVTSSATTISGAVTLAVTKGDVNKAATVANVENLGVAGTAVNLAKTPEVQEGVAAAFDMFSSAVDWFKSFTETKKPDPPPAPAAPQSPAPSVPPTQQQDTKDPSSK